MIRLPLVSRETLDRAESEVRFLRELLAASERRNDALTRQVSAIAVQATAPPPVVKPFVPVLAQSVLDVIEDIAAGDAALAGKLRKRAIAWRMEWPNVTDQALAHAINDNRPPTGAA